MALFVALLIALTSVAAVQLPAARTARGPLGPLRSTTRCAGAPCCMESAEERIKEMIGANKVFLFMKGNKLMPQCGFSNTATQILNAIDAPYETFDVLSDYDIREGVKKYSAWPTIPQCYIDGEFVGGCDIMIEMYESGELQEIIEVATAS